MIQVIINKADFEYDIFTLLKAFYPGEDIKVDAGHNCCKGKAETSEIDDEIKLFLEVNYMDNRGNPWVDDGMIEFKLHENTGDEELIHLSLINTERVFTDFNDRVETKNALKKKLYEILRDYSGIELPWGNLTGIRPTKIPMALMEEGMSEEDIAKYMKEKYFVSDEKISLNTEVARREKALLDTIDVENGYSLYVGIPFCPTTCLYCSFTSFPIGKWASRVDEYLDCLEKEMVFTAEAYADKHLDSIYIGGGTPTTLEPYQIDRLLTMIEKYFNDGRSFSEYRDDAHSELDTGAKFEFTVEAGRPDSITREKLEVINAHGIDRISINPQTMNDKTLKLIGRQHTVDQVKECFALAREVGFENINMDLIVGLPDETIEDVRHTMEELSLLKPDSVTVHSLAIKRASRLNIDREEYAHHAIENTWATIALTREYCEKMGLNPYYLYRQKNMAGNFENVGYSRPGCEGIYNILIMEEKQTIVALGAGAVTKLVYPDGRIERAANVKDITNYLDRVDEMIERKRVLLVT